MLTYTVAIDQTYMK